MWSTCCRRRATDSSGALTSFTDPGVPSPDGFRPPRTNRMSPVGVAEPAAGSSVMPQAVGARSKSSSITIVSRISPPSARSSTLIGTGPDSSMSHSSYAMPSGASGRSSASNTARSAAPDQATLTSPSPSPWSVANWASECSSTLASSVAYVGESSPSTISAPAEHDRRGRRGQHGRGQATASATTLSQVGHDSTAGAVRAVASGRPLPSPAA